MGEGHAHRLGCHRALRMHTARQRCCRAAVTRPTHSVSPATFATQAAIDDPALIKGVQIMNISLRMLHVSKQAPWQRPLVKALQVCGCGWMRGPCRCTALPLCR